MSKKYTVELYEKDSYFGGHACTIKSKLSSHKGNKKTVYFDIGFLVFNNENYPNFKNFIKIVATIFLTYLAYASIYVSCH